VEARADFDAVMAEIRGLPGYEVFGAPLTLAQIAEVARPAPLVYLAATAAGGVALIVTGDGRVSPVWLPAFDAEAVRARLEDEKGYAAAYRAWREKRIAWRTWARVLDRTLRWAWDAVVGPVLQALSAEGHHAAVLVAPGLLQLLPLHAAWTEDPDGPDNRRYAVDVAMLTCAPSARVLAAARPPRSTAGAALLLVDNPDGTLQGADREQILRLGGFHPATSRVLAGEEATQAAVLAALPGAEVVQFTTHGRARVADPLRSGVKLARKEWLEAGEILGTRLDRDPLVFLSACETTLPGTALPEEVVSLPTAFMQAGAGGVIASLWPVWDEETGETELAFYARTGAGGSPARALHQVRTEMRAAGVSPYVWAAFTYTGPLG
jgi:CHAT domain-containing protein